MPISDGILVLYETGGVVAAASQTPATLIASTAFLAHIGGFVFGAVVATSLVADRQKAHRLRPPESQTGR